MNKIRIIMLCSMVLGVLAVVHLAGMVQSGDNKALNAPLVPVHVLPNPNPEESEVSKSSPWIADKELFSGVSQQEVEQALRIALSDPTVARIVSDTNFSYVAGQWQDESGVKVGIALLLILEKPVWAEATEFWPGEEPTKVKAWVKSVQLLIDLNKKRVAGMILNMGPPGDANTAHSEATSISVPEEVKQVALNYAKKTIGDPNVEVRLIGVYRVKNSEVAFFVAKSQGKERLMIAIDTLRLDIINEYTAPIGG